MKQLLRNNLAQQQTSLNQLYSNISKQGVKESNKGFSQLSRRQILTRQRSHNQNQQGHSYKQLISLLLLGGCTMTMQSYFPAKNRLSSLAQAEQDNTTQQQLERVSSQVREEHLQLNSKVQVLFIYYDSRQALQREFMHDIEVKSIVEKLLKKYPNLSIVKLDVNDPSFAENNLNQEVINVVEYGNNKISNKKKPTIFLRADDRIVKFKANYLNKNYDQFNTAFQKESSFYIIKSVKDLAERLNQFNKSLNDTTIVYVHDPSKATTPTDGTSNVDTKQISFRLMRQETENPILQINDLELAQKLNMQPGKFYCYFKPSFINGYEQYIDKDINFCYLQAYEGICRDEFQINEEKVQSEEFSNHLKRYRGFQTEKFAIQNFDQYFTRTFTVEFVFNPNFSEFKRKFKTGTSQKPMIFIYSPAMYMSRYIGEFKQVLQNYTEVFDVYYTEDHNEAQQLFYTKEFPDIFPYVAIVDTKKKKGLKSSAGTLHELTLENNNFYFQKYREIIFFNDIQKNVNKLIDKFLDGEAHHYYQSQRMNQETRVKKICSANFEQQILKNPKIEQCIVEVFKHDCPSCAFNGKVFNVFSRKLEKHGYLNKLPLYRLSIDNKVPQLGNFGYSPIYMYVRKRGNEIVEIKTLDPPQRPEEFLKQIEEHSKLKGLTEKIKIKARDQIIKHIRLEDLDENFDIDFDTVEEPQPELQPTEQAQKA
ncbi:UNKNOWN [Stylonychia lemnae]|uniref:Thioredoxin domain-containing protein n=1 Tax=Stylonychia lemnae TaxID=5949 RepID=A0A078AU91_STYLE|nr:UNKNOWN [Stylonychia lemnae]|eukprot:CDW85809.1 UNKNOWN [Stylonychia lemnae]